MESARWDGASGLELVLAPSGEDQARYAVESVREIDRHAACATLRTFGLAPAVPSLFSEPFRRGRDGAKDRIVIVRLASRQTLRMFEAIRGRHPNVGRLYADLEGKGFDLIPGWARGTVMRSYTADGVVRGGGVVVELPHEGTEGEIASFHVSTREGMGRGDHAGVSADYSIRRAERAENREEVRAGNAPSSQEPLYELTRAPPFTRFDD